jgi:NAD+ synthase (glutamine-hydrolysing)
MRIALCQLNPIVGDLAGNAEKVLAAARRADDAGADLAVFSELVLTGYPPQDLLERTAFLDAADAALAHVAAHAPAGLGIILGAPRRNADASGKGLRNAAVVLDGGAVVGEAAKVLLPTYDVFDEHRYFEPATACAPVLWRGLRLGLHVCEDMWNNHGVDGAANDDGPRPLYGVNPIDRLGEAGVDLFVNVSASPFAAGKAAERHRLMAHSAAEWSAPFVYVNQVGANTELIFDGDSQVVAADGTVLARCAAFAEDFLLWDWAEGRREEEGGKRETADDGSRAPALPRPPAPTPPRIEPVPEGIAAIHDALVLGIADYVAKSGDAVFPYALVGLSGGIDSAVTCALAVEALGADRVVGITMPSKYSSGGSVTDARALAENLGVAFHEVSIRPAVDAFDAMLAPVLGAEPSGVTEENVQARARGVTLMAVSNAGGHLVLTTGNKSEMAVGYATLYGDMSGGLAVLSDVFKTEVYALAEHINARAGRDLIPQGTITKPPSAELRPDQTDQDTLPPYDVLDAILERYIEAHEDVEAIVAATGFERSLVARVAGMVDRNEYKRRQAAPGLRVSPKAFGVGRRLPIVMRRTVVAAP